MSNELTVHQPSNLSAFANEHSFAVAQRMVKPLIQSGLVPVAYQGEQNIGNALIALDMANRMGLSPIVVMQNLHIIEGRPSWAASFIISALASCGLFSPIRWRVTDLGMVDAEKVVWEGPKGARTKKVIKEKIHDKEFVAYAVEKATGEVLEGPPVTFSMAIAEGWFHRPGSKWLTMPDLMGRYRSAAFFGRLYAPHITNGMMTDEESTDIAPHAYSAPDGAEDAQPQARKKKASVADVLKAAADETIIDAVAVVVETEEKNDEKNPVKEQPKPVPEPKQEPVKQERPTQEANISMDSRDFAPITDDDLY